MGSGTPKDAAIAIAGWLSKTASTSAGDIFSPARLINSSTGHCEVAVAIENSQVARSKPTVDEGFLVRCEIARIAVHDGLSAHDHFTLVSGL